mgnify:CR=1 FL=1
MVLGEIMRGKEQTKTKLKAIRDDQSAEKISFEMVSKAFVDIEF